MEQKISIVTPVFNGEKYIEECILSIMNQKYSNYEHIIVDGGSSDNTLNIIKKYEGQYPMKWISEKDNGMYDAICKGFSMATGDIFAWLNADDTYLPWTFQAVNEAMTDGVNWCTGINAVQDQNDILYVVRNARYYRQKWLAKGYYGSIISYGVQQESTFWKKELWLNSDTEIIKQYRYAGDWKLWTLFAKTEPLYTVTTVIGRFRRHPGQLSGNTGAYSQEVDRIPNKLKRVCTRISVGFLSFLFARCLPYFHEKNVKFAKKTLKRIDLIR